MVPEAPIEETPEGLHPVPPGWFVVNGREARWRRRPGRGHSVPFTGWSDEECETHFRQIGIGMVVVEPGEPTGMYHWENDQEEFLVLAGEAILIIEGEERPLRQWDFAHEAALRHGAGVAEEANTADVAYQRFSPSEPTRYQDGWLPG